MCEGSVMRFARAPQEHRLKLMPAHQAEGGKSNDHSEFAIQPRLLLRVAAQTQFGMQEGLSAHYWFAGPSWPMNNRRHQPWRDSKQTPNLPTWIDAPPVSRPRYHSPLTVFVLRRSVAWVTSRWNVTGSDQKTATLLLLPGNWPPSAVGLVHWRDAASKA